MIVAVVLMIRREKRFFKISYLPRNLSVSLWEGSLRSSFTRCCGGNFRSFGAHMRKSADYGLLLSGAQQSGAAWQSARRTKKSPDSTLRPALNGPIFWMGVGLRAVEPGFLHPQPFKKAPKSSVLIRVLILHLNQAGRPAKCMTP